MTSGPFRFLFALLMLAGTPLHAQEVRGRVVGSASGLPVGGAFVVLLDSAGATAASTLSNERGAFSLPARRAGTYTIRVERLALRAFVTQPFVLDSGAVVTRDVTVTETAVALPAVTARAAREGCRSFGDLDDETEIVWEEARKALSVAVWTARHAPVRLHIVRSLRERYAGSGRLYLEADDNAVREMRGSPWGSAPADQLVRLGFVRPHGGGYLYYGPDADVLLSDEFLATHCFRVAQHPDSTDLVGLEFQPRGPRRVADISGTLWLNRRTAELRTLDYRYVNLPFKSEDDRIGGTAEYLRLQSGLWILGGWTLSAPRPENITPLRQRGRQELLMSEHIARVVRASDPQGRALYAAPHADQLIRETANRPADIPIPGGTMPARLWAAQRCTGTPRPDHAHIVGSVGDRNGRPLLATLQLAVKTGRQVREWTARTDVEGLFFFCNVPAAQPYGLKAVADGYLAADQGAPGGATDLAGHRFLLDER